MRMGREDGLLRRRTKEIRKRERKEARKGNQERVYGKVMEEESRRRRRESRTLPRDAMSVTHDLRSAQDDGGTLTACTQVCTSDCME